MQFSTLTFSLFNRIFDLKISVLPTWRKTLLWEICSLCKDYSEIVTFSLIFLWCDLSNHDFTLADLIDDKSDWVGGRVFSMRNSGFATRSRRSRVTGDSNSAPSTFC